MKVASNTVDPTVITWKYCAILYASVKCVTIRLNAGLKVGGYSPRDLGKDRLLCFSILRVRHYNGNSRPQQSVMNTGWGGHRVSCDEKVLLPDDVTYQKNTLAPPLLDRSIVTFHVLQKAKNQKTKLTFYNDQSHHFTHSTQHSFNNYVLSAYYMLEETQSMS